MYSDFDLKNILGYPLQRKYLVRNVNRNVVSYVNVKLDFRYFEYVKIKC